MLVRGLSKLLIDVQDFSSRHGGFRDSVGRLFAIDSKKQKEIPQVKQKRNGPFLIGQLQQSYRCTAHSCKKNVGIKVKGKLSAQSARAARMLGVGGHTVIHSIGQMGKQMRRRVCV